MKLIYIGSGYVGTCSAAISAHSGHDVLIYDIDREKINKFASFNRQAIESCFFEEGLADLLDRNRDRLNFTDDIKMVSQYADKAGAIFMCLPTPEKDESGETDMKYYEDAIRTLSLVLAGRNNGEQSNYVFIINKSTVPINTSNLAKRIMDSYGVKNYGIGSNPEFLVEGKAIEGSMRPERVVVGAWQKRDFAIFRDIYKRFVESPSTTYIEVNPFEAETGKLMANFALFKRLAVCFDVLGRVCEHFDNMHFENVRKILISDSRIGDWGFYNSLFAGGSCFIKDSRSLSYQLKQKGVNTTIIDNVIDANHRQLNNFLARPEKELRYNWSGKKIGILGLSFKRDTDDVRNSAAIGITEFLLDRGVDAIKAYDPIARDNYLKYFIDHPHFGSIHTVATEEEAMAGMDVLFIAADWPQFRELADLIKEKFPGGGLIMDGRRMLQNKYKELSEAGYAIIAVGSPTIRACNA